jgi:Na+-exporting ATPase
LTQGKTAAKKAWIPGRGAYAVGTSDDHLNPTIGDVPHVDKAPRDSKAPDTHPPSSIEQLLQDNHDLEQFLNVASMANLTHVHKAETAWKAWGDPTDIAIKVFAPRFHWNRSRLTAGESPR